MSTRYEWEMWENSAGNKVHVPLRHGVAEGDVTVEVTAEAMAELLAAAGYSRVAP